MANYHGLHIVPQSSVATICRVYNFYVIDTRNIQCKFQASSLTEGSGLSSNRSLLLNSGFRTWIYAKLEYTVLNLREIRYRPIPPGVRIRSRYAAVVKCVLGARRPLTFPVNVAFAPELARASVRLDVEAEEGRIASQQKR